MCWRTIRGNFASFNEEKTVNESTKSSMVQEIMQSPDVYVYPDEGNVKFWFPDFFPWLPSNKNVLPF